MLEDGNELYRYTLQWLVATEKIKQTMDSNSYKLTGDLDGSIHTQMDLMQKKFFHLQNQCESIIVPLSTLQNYVLPVFHA